MPLYDREESFTESRRGLSTRQGSRSAGQRSPLPKQRYSDDRKGGQAGRGYLSAAENARRTSSKAAPARRRWGESSLPELGRSSDASALARAAIASLPGVLNSRATGSRTPSSTSYQKKSKSARKKSSKSAVARKKKKKSDVDSRGSSRKGNRGRSSSTRSAGSRRSPQQRGASKSKARTSKRKSVAKEQSAASSTKEAQAQRGSTRDTRKRSTQRHPATGTRRSKPNCLVNSVRQNWMTQLEMLEEEESAQRQAILHEEELEREGYTPIYNMLMTDMVRVCIEQINKQQKLLHDTFEKLRSDGVLIGNDDNVDVVMEKLRCKMGNDGVSELYRLRAEKDSLREQLDAKTLELELKTADLEVLRQNAVCMIAQKVARVDVDTDNLKTMTERVLMTTTLDIARMKKELMQRIDIATAHLRTPQYGTALRSMRELTAQIQREIQQHHDSLVELIMLIEAKSNLAKFVSATMHSNIPPEYRSKLRQMSNDKLLNILDVLSFQEGTVDCIGKVLYALEESEHKTAVI